MRRGRSDVRAFSPRLPVAMMSLLWLWESAVPTWLGSAQTSGGRPLAIGGLRADFEADRLHSP